MAKVKANHYVKDDPETLPIILETMKFLCDLETISTKSDEMQTPALAVPRLPHEVIFAIGGWSEGAPQNVIETYDTRAGNFWYLIDLHFLFQLFSSCPRSLDSHQGFRSFGSKVLGIFDKLSYDCCM